MTSVAVGAHESNPHAEDPAVVGRRWRTGVPLIMLADIAFVAALLFSYLYLRGLNTSKAWLAPKQQTASVWVSWLIAAVLVASVIAFRSGHAGIRVGARGRLLAGTAMAVVLVLADVVAQLIQLATLPFGVAVSAYSSEIYLLGGANLVHLFLTLFLGVGVWNRARIGLYTKDDHRQLTVIGYWWMWIAIAQVATALVTSFVASPNI
jgi:heme/copper-type cytochrome/quinol oxidase subunit 3